MLGEEDGDLRRALGEWLAEVEHSLGAAFDENSKTSVIAKLERVLEDARDTQVASMRRLLDPDADESPIARWRYEIVTTLEKQLAGVTASLEALRQQLDLKAVQQEAMEKTAVKGFAFEETVLAALQGICQPLQDVPAYVGDLTGDRANKVGDILVALDATLVRGREAAYVVECKDKKLSLKKALDELDEAIENRRADAGVMVFAQADQSPCTEPFHWYDHKAIVVLDKNTADPSALRLACLWARWVACREDREAADGLDTARLTDLIDDARRSLKTIATVRGCNTKAKHALDDASGHLDTLDADLQRVLNELALHLSAKEHT